MQSLGVKGKHGEHGKFKQYPSLTPKMHLNSYSKETQTWVQPFITTWNYISHHHVKFGTQKMKQNYNMNSKLLLGCYSSPLPTLGLVPRSKPKTTRDTQNEDDLHAPI